jgi:hypothetical protein
MSLSHLLNTHSPIWSPRAGGVWGGGGGGGENFLINGREARVLVTGGGRAGGGGVREHQEAYDVLVVRNSQKYSL